MTTVFFNGKKTYITWGFGHLVELVPPEKYKDDWKEWMLETSPIFPNEFKFQVGKGKKKQFNVVKQLLKNASEIIVATDSVTDKLKWTVGHADKILDQNWSGGKLCMPMKID